MYGPGRRFGGALVAVALVSILLPLVAEAMPGFARKYRVSCTTCHAPFPRLKPFGDEFAGAGFRMPDPAAEPARAVVDAGDPLLELARDVPLGFRFEGFYDWREGKTADNDMQVPWTWKILSGGPLGKNAAYYFYFLVERGEVEGLEDAYLQYNGIFGWPVDLMFGQFQICDPMFKREARLEKSDYLIYKTEVGASGLDLTYDRGVILLTSAAETDFVLQVVNGNGIPHADGERNFDDDPYKNVALFAGRDVGPVGLGLFGYWGKQEDAAERCNTTWYFGPNATVPLGGAELNLQYLERRDDNPWFADTDPADPIETRGGLAELHVFPQGEDGRWAISGLYNWVDSDDDAADRQTGSVTVNYLVARNLRVLVEGGYDIEEELGFGTTGLVSGF